MIADIWTVMWKEWRELLFQRGSIRGTILSWLPLVVLFGIFVPSQSGRFWVESPMPLGFWGWLPTLPVMPIIADAFAGERERHTLETLLASPLSESAILFGKVGAVVVYACGLTLIILLLALVTVNIVHGSGELLLYPVTTTLSGVVLSVLTATLVAGVGVFVSLRTATVKEAAQKLGFASIALTWIPLLGLGFLPTQLQVRIVKSALSGSATQLSLITIIIFLTVLDAVLLLAAKARFKRDRLILD